MLVDRASSVLDKMEAYTLRTILCTGYYTPKEAISAGLTALRYLGVIIPEKPGKGYLIREIMEIKSNLLRKDIASIIHLPEMTDEQAKKAMNLLANLTPPTSLVNPQLFSYILLKMTSISLKYGNADYSAFAYACYGIVCGSRFHDYKKAAQLQFAALTLGGRCNNHMVKSKVYYTIATYLNHWNYHVSKNFEYGEKANFYASKAGDWVIAGVVQAEMVQLECILGESVDAIRNRYEIALRSIRYGMPDTLNLLRTISQFLKNLQGETDNPFTLSNKDYDESTTAKKMLNTNKGFIVHHYYLMKMQCHYLHGNIMEAFNIALKQHDNMESILGKMLYAENVYWICLSAFGAYNQLDKSGKKHALKVIKHNMNLLKKWSEACEENFLHKYLLASAEISRLKGNVDNAIELYDKAVSSAKKHGYNLDTAVAYELAARFYFESGLLSNGNLHMASAYKAYTDYGALRKAEMLEGEFPGLFSGKNAYTTAHDLDFANVDAEEYAAASTDNPADGYAVASDEKEDHGRNDSSPRNGAEQGAGSGDLLNEVAGKISDIAGNGVDYLSLSRAVDSFFLSSNEKNI